MDRERKDELPQMQVEFIDAVCKPLYTTLSDSFPWIKPLLDGCMSNREKWADLAEKVIELLEVALLRPILSNKVEKQCKVLFQSYTSVLNFRWKWD